MTSRESFHVHVNPGENLNVSIGRLRNGARVHVSTERVSDLDGLTVIDVATAVGGVVLPQGRMSRSSDLTTSVVEHISGNDVHVSVIFAGPNYPNASAETHFEIRVEDGPDLELVMSDALDRLVEAVDHGSYKQSTDQLDLVVRLWKKEKDGT